MALPIASRQHGIAGVADLVEFRAGARMARRLIPVEYKRGKPKLHRADEVQLCAQALCLEEMTGHPVPEGALYLRSNKAASRRAVRRRTCANSLPTPSPQLRDVFATQTTPPAQYRADRCRACSLIELCRPKAASKSAAAWRTRMLTTLLR